MSVKQKAGLLILVTVLIISLGLGGVCMYKIVVSPPGENIYTLILTNIVTGLTTILIPSPLSNGKKYYTQRGTEATGTTQENEVVRNIPADEGG
jgi:hypothetical protein